MIENNPRKNDKFPFPSLLLALEVLLLLSMAFTSLIPFQSPNAAPSGYHKEPNSWVTSLQSSRFEVTTAKVYLPLIYKRYPPIPDAPVLDPINNPDGSKYYSLSWNMAYLADAFVLEEDDNQTFSSPTGVYDGNSPSWWASGKDPGTYYYRVKAYNSWGVSTWSNIQSTTVVLPLSEVYVINDTGCKVCYEVKNTGIGKKCYSTAGSNYYGSFPAGTYSWSGSACCGSVSGSGYYGEGAYDHRFWCRGSQISGDNASGVQCELKLDQVTGK